MLTIKADVSDGVQTDCIKISCDYISNIVYSTQKDSRVHMTAKQAQVAGFELLQCSLDMLSSNMTAHDADEIQETLNLLKKQLAV
ncbi:MAG: hypothetical protein [Caudoviricetes sp.]|nr:MAG: hypothetical protein [Caudoviricetes sp.]